MYIVKKRKYEDCEKLPSKCTTNDNNFFIKIKLMLIKVISMLYQVFLFGLVKFSITKMQNQGVYH